MRLLLTCVPVFLTITACGSGDQASPVSKATPSAVVSAAPPLPSIVSSTVYRCPDHSLLHVDWLSDGRSADVVFGRGEPRVHVESVLPGGPMVGGGNVLRGARGAASIAVARPDGLRSLTCRA